MRATSSAISSQNSCTKRILSWDDNLRNLDTIGSMLICFLERSLTQFPRFNVTRIGTSLESSMLPERVVGHLCVYGSLLANDLVDRSTRHAEPLCQGLLRVRLAAGMISSRSNSPGCVGGSLSFFLRSLSMSRNSFARCNAFKRI